jgi:hypothetical protein
MGITVVSAAVRAGSGERAMWQVERDAGSAAVLACGRMSAAEPAGAQLVS